MKETVQQTATLALLWHPETALRSTGCDDEIGSKIRGHNGLQRQVAKRLILERPRYSEARQRPGREMLQIEFARERYRKPLSGKTRRPRQILPRGPRVEL